MDPVLFIILNTVPMSFAHVSNSKAKSVSLNWSKTAHSEISFLSLDFIILPRSTVFMKYFSYGFNFHV